MVHNHIKGERGKIREIVRDWNCLPEESVHALSPESFRAYISA